MHKEPLPLIAFPKVCSVECRELLSAKQSGGGALMLNKSASQGWFVVNIIRIFDEPKYTGNLLGGSKSFLKFS